MTQPRNQSRTALARPSEADLDEIQAQHREAKTAGKGRVFHDGASIREQLKKHRR